MYYYIINPAAGNGRINKIQTKLKARLKELDIAGEFVKSTGVGDVTKLARMGIEKGYKTIVAVGGDGTIHEVINGIDDSNVALGIIPMGSTNELANTLGIPDWQSASNILSARKTEVMDLGKIGEKLFVTNVSLGFNNFLLDLLGPKNNSSLGRLKFGASLFSKAVKFKSFPVTLEFAENYNVEADCFNLTISNGKFFNILPQKSFSMNQSKPQDNLLDVIIIGSLPFSKIIKFSSAKPGSEIVDPSRISVFRTRKVKIKTKKPLTLTADGQVVTDTPAVVEIADKKLRVIVSRDRKF